MTGTFAFGGDCSVVILAGGGAKRMGGENKAFLRLGRSRFIDRQLQILTTMSPAIFVSCPSPDIFAELPCTPIADRFGGLGPLDGVASVMEHMSTTWLWVVACDMPYIHRPFFDRLERSCQAQISTPDFVVPQIRDRFEPLCALYQRSCLPAMKERLAKHQLSLQDFCRNPDAELTPLYVEEAELRSVDPDLRFKKNINSKSDWLQISS